MTTTHRVKTPRELQEMVEALARQLRLLEAYIRNAQTNSDYWGEVATKLRLLLIEGGSNRALLFRVAEKYRDRVTVDLHPEYPHSWDKTLDSPMLTYGNPPLRSITFREVICASAEQQGGAHEDWSIDEMLLATQRDSGATMPSGQCISLAHTNLTAMALRALEAGRRLLAAIQGAKGTED